MITLSRRLALQLRSVMRRAFGRRVGPAVLFSTDAGMLHVQANSGDVAVEYAEPAPAATETLRLPLEFLADCEGKSDEPVQIEAAGKEAVTARRRDGRVPQIVRYDAPKHAVQGAFPSIPAEARENPPSILKALCDAAQTTDPDSVRFATRCIQLRGRDGSLRATDGRQLLVQAGYGLPWTDDVLIPASAVFGCKEFPPDSPVRIGRSDDWVSVGVGRWTIHLRIDKEGRFPELDNHLGSDAPVTARLRIAAADAGFLANVIGKLPCSDEAHHPVTVDLNGCVSVRARGPGQTEPTEAVLSNSSYSGEPVRFHTNRKFLARAMQLGFHDLDVAKAHAPVLCRDGRRTYVWAVLDPEAAIPPSKDSIRIVSPADDPPAVPTRPISRSSTTMSETTVDPNAASGSKEPRARNTPGSANSQSRDRKPRKARQQEAMVLIEQAQRLRTAARELLTQTGQMLKALRQHRRQSRIVASTLRQLKTLGV